MKIRTCQICGIKSHLSRCLDPDCDGPCTTDPAEETNIEDPITQAYTLSEIDAKLKLWMKAEYGDARDCKTLKEREQWYRHYGMIYHFLSDIFPHTKP